MKLWFDSTWVHLRNSMQTKQNIAVIGAGISGLIVAYELQKLGHTVTVFEKEKPQEAEWLL